MKIIIQRVKEAKMFVNTKYKCEIEQGILAFVGITHDDNEKDIDYCVDKLINLRIFSDDDGKMNLSVQDVDGSLMIVSNFTIYGETRKGRRPSYTESAPADKAREIYNIFLKKLLKTRVPFETGEFQVHMDIEAINYGPITLIIESPKN